MHMVAARLGCVRVMVVTGQVTSCPECMDRLTNATPPCRELISGKEGCLGSEWVCMATNSTDYCMLINEWA